MLLLKARLALELPPINKALSRAAEGLPHPVRPIARHIFEAGGKRLRPLLTILMARLLGYDKKDIYDLAVTMEMLHAATLLHDDVLDNADTRRGKPAAHTIFNATSTILAGDAMLAHANALVAQCGDPRLCLCFSEATSRTAAGEILEIAAQHQVETTAEEYEEIIRGKTAWLIRASCQLGALRAGADEALVEAAAAYGENIGMAFQIVDDGTQGVIHITLKYNAGKEKVISGLRRVSKPGLRVYVGADELPRVLRGLGIAIVSTSKGVMTDKKARELHVGGEVLAFVW